MDWEQVRQKCFRDDPKILHEPFHDVIYWNEKQAGMVVRVSFCPNEFEMPTKLPVGESEWDRTGWNSENGPGCRLHINGIQSNNSLNRGGKGTQNQCQGITWSTYICVKKTDSLKMRLRAELRTIEKERRDQVASLWRKGKCCLQEDNVSSLFCMSL